MSLRESFYPEIKFGGFSDIDGTVAFFTRVNSLLSPTSVVLDVGCGRGAHSEGSVSTRKSLKIFRGKVKKVIGIDVDPAARENPYLDEFHLVNGGKWPVEDGSVDLLVSDNVVEHVENPETFFKEVQRVLKPGGYCCLRTPNAWSYFGLCSRLIPNKFHYKVKTIVQKPQNEEDVFPTYYRCNSMRKIRNMFKRHGCTCAAVYGHESEPAYLSFSKIAYFFGILHQKFAPRCVKPVLFAFARKDGYGGAGALSAGR